MDDYSGAAAMYGLVLLNSDYTGDCVTVRRASDNATQNIGFDGQDLDIASLEAFCSGTDGFVTTWYDQSGNANNATQTTAANQPQIVSSGSVITENGKPAIDIYDKIVNLDTPSLSTDSVFAVSKMNAFGLVNYLVYNTSLVQGLLLKSFETQLLGVYDVAFKNSTISSVLTQSLTTFVFDTNYKVALNGSSLDSITTATTKIPTNSISRSFSGALGLNGIIQSLIFYDSDQSSNKTGIEAALNDYYNIF